MDTPKRGSTATVGPGGELQRIGNWDALQREETHPGSRAEAGGAGICELQTKRAPAGLFRDAPAGGRTIRGGDRHTSLGGIIVGRGGDGGTRGALGAAEQRPLAQVQCAWPLAGEGGGYSAQDAPCTLL